jgi:hypothetical protein
LTLQDRNRVNSEEKLLTLVHITAAETAVLILWTRNSMACEEGGWQRSATQAQATGTL